MTSEGSPAWSKRTKTFLRAGILILIVFFVWFQLDYMSASDYVPPHSEINDSTTLPVTLRRILPGNLENVAIEKIEPQQLENTSVVIDKDKVLNISNIKHIIDQMNYLQTIYNENLYGPLQNDSIVIVVQVHDRMIYLRHLVDSLAKARDISRALLVFSHDYYDEEINDLIKSIDFCKVTQIFYPHSIQTHPNEFPGEDPKDCPRDLNRDKAASTNCINAQHPDLHGHYREAKMTQTKHHWWWKANWVFNHLRVTMAYTGLVLLIEEDHYVAEDFIYMLKLMEKTCKESGKDCDIFSLGLNSKYDDLGRDSKKVLLTYHFSNMGMALNRFTWQRILECAEKFCNYDDYNWDWTLQYISDNCVKSKLLSMVAKGPRVFHIGECGMHHKKENCDSVSAVNRFQNMIKNAAGQLFPDSLTVPSVATSSSRIQKPNGGWGDVRDHELCLNAAKRR